MEPFELSRLVPWQIAIFMSVVEVDDLVKAEPGLEIPPWVIDEPGLKNLDRVDDMKRSSSIQRPSSKAIDDADEGLKTEPASKKKVRSNFEKLFMLPVRGANTGILLASYIV